jgi:DNA-binding NtrC family response regulator
MMSDLSNNHSNATVLVVDDHAAARGAVVEILTDAGYRVSSCASGTEGLSRIKRQSFDVIVTDLMMPGMTGIEMIQAMRQLGCDSQFIMVTAHGTVETAVQAMRFGAYDYIEKPFDAPKLESIIARAIGQSPRSSMLTSNKGTSAILGESQAIKTLRQQISQTAPTNETVLICGESGTGKELVARQIHLESQRATQALVCLNCPSLSPSLMESELFGHEKGAFTNADTPREGRFELADRGTIFLDEITEIDLTMQAKLLRVIQEKSYERVGSSVTRTTDVRVVASSNRDLQLSVDAGNFRADLYYRLAVIPIHVPPLRARGTDVLLLARHFLDRNALRNRREPMQLAQSAQDLLLAYRWPGNVRELESVMTRVSVLLSGNSVDADDLRPWLIDHDCDQSTQNHISIDPLAVGSSLREMERQLIEATLERYNGHREKTAEVLGIGVRTLTGRLRSYGYAPREKSYLKRSFAKVA